MRGCEYVYCGQPVGYCREPCESVAYNGCHDNHTVFDQARARRQGRGEARRFKQENAVCSVWPPQLPDAPSLQPPSSPHTYTQP